MESMIGSDVSVISLLVFFIVALLTKRIVPWWIYEETLQKLKEYEEAAPELLDEMNKLMEVLRDPKNIERVNLVAPEVKNIAVLTKRKPPILSKKKASHSDLHRAAQTLEKARKRLNTHE